MGPLSATECRCCCLPFLCDDGHRRVSERTASWVHWGCDTRNDQRPFSTEVALIVAATIVFAPLSSGGIFAALVFWIVWEVAAAARASEAARLCPVHCDAPLITKIFVMKRALVVALAVVSRTTVRAILRLRG